MFSLNESMFKQELPARARRLFVKTFQKYHKLDGGDEEVALHMARQAVDRDYVKLNDRYIPKTAAEEIVRHDMINTDDDSDSEEQNQQQQRHQQTTSQKIPPHTFQEITNKRQYPSTDDSDEYSTDASLEEDDGYEDDYSDSYTLSPKTRIKTTSRFSTNKKINSGRINIM